jgi:undecaprenyl-diphosphatase
MIQLGAIFAVVIIYFKKLYPFKYNDNEYDQKEKITIWLKVIISCIPVVIIGLLLDDFITSYFYNLFVIAITLILYGILFIVVENKKKKNYIKSIKNVGVKDAGIIGCAQVLSLIPGTSRSGVTILSGMLLGFDRTSSAEYSFYLSVPIMFGASIYKLIKYVFNFKIMMKEVIILVIGMIVAMLISLIVIKNLLNYIKKHGFKVFGIYRIILGIVILVIWSL